MITKIIAKYYDLLQEKNTICSRKDYWIFVLINFFISTIMLFSSAILIEFGLPYIFLLPFFIIFLFISAIQIILSVKRMHDINLSGFWLLFPGIALILLPLPSVTYKNNYKSKEELLTEEDKEENEKLEAFISLLENQNTEEKK